MEIIICNTKAGVVKIKIKNKCIYELAFTNEPITHSTPDYINNFFNNNSIDITYFLDGTDFQKLVWEQLLLIPFGETRTYSDIAICIGKPKAYRAVSNACGKNKIAILIPCHRVVGKNNIGGYEYGIDIKKRLLKLEK